MAGFGSGVEGGDGHGIVGASGFEREMLCSATALWEGSPLTRCPPHRWHARWACTTWRRRTWLAPAVPAERSSKTIRAAWSQTQRFFVLRARNNSNARTSMHLLFRALALLIFHSPSSHEPYVILCQLCATMWELSSKLVGCEWKDSYGSRKK